MVRYGYRIKHKVLIQNSSTVEVQIKHLRSMFFVRTIFTEQLNFKITSQEILNGLSFLMLQAETFIYEMYYIFW